MNRVKLDVASLLRNRVRSCAFGFAWLRLTGAIAGILVSTYALSARAKEPAKPVTTAERQAPSTIASPDEIGRWIEELGHDTFTVRQTAASRLLAAGMPARDALIVIADGPDPEKRAAARRLVALIDQSEFHRRLEAFAADIDGHLGLSLPGWEQYQKLVGTDPMARALFVDMQRQEAPLIAAIFGAPNRSPGELVRLRLIQLVQWQNLVNNRSATPPLGSTAALLFLGSISEVDVSENTAAQIGGLLQRPPISESLKPDDPQDAVRRLAVAWLMHCPTKNDEILRQRLSIISNLGLEEALPLPRAVTTGEAPYQRAQPSVRGYAMLIVGQLGGREDVDRLEPLLDDTTPCFQLQQQLPGQNLSVQIRDVALVVLLQLTGQRPADYGYVGARLQPPVKIYQPASLYRDNDQQRAEAIAKWREWRAAQKNAPSPAKSK